MKMFKLMIFGMLLATGFTLAACGQPAEPVVEEVPEPAVLEQPTELPTEVPPPPVEAATLDVVDALAADGRFTVLSAAIARVGLTETLKGAGPFTVFAPTDEAFAKLAEGTIEGLTDEELMNVLLNHVVLGMMDATGVMAMDGTALGTMNPAGTVTVTVEGETVMLGDAMVVEADIMATNGFVHAIDNVLVPAMGDAASMEDGAVAPSDAMTNTYTTPMTATLTAP